MSKRALLNMTILGMFTLIPLLNAADGPIPAQIFSAKKVFISIAQDDCVIANQAANGCTPGAYYNEFYAAVKQWGQFDLTTSPADADLVFELHHSLTWAGGVDERYRLAIIDARTHFTLWSFVVFPEGASRVSTIAKNNGLARAQIVTNLKLMFAQTPDPKGN